MWRLTRQDETHLAVNNGTMAMPTPNAAVQAPCSPIRNTPASWLPARRPAAAPPPSGATGPTPHPANPRRTVWPTRPKVGSATCLLANQGLDPAGALPAHVRVSDPLDRRIGTVDTEFDTAVRGRQIAYSPLLKKSRGG